MVLGGMLPLSGLKGLVGETAACQATAAVELVYNGSRQRGPRCLWSPSGGDGPLIGGAK
jgi:hypothetical protein